MGTVIRNPMCISAEKRAAAGLLSDEQVEKIADEHGGVVAHRVDPLARWEIVFRTPTRPEFKMWQSDCANELTKLDGDENLLRRIIVHAGEAQPGGVAKTVTGPEILDKYLGIAMGSGEEVLHITGLSSKPWGK
jgi:hypothetical protein